MVTQRSRLKFTYEDYKQTPDDTRYELLDGELILVPAPRLTHQRTSRTIFRQIDSFVTERDLGEVFYAPADVVLSDFTVVQPDILFVSKERSHIITDDNIRGAPDLVVEILSPTTARRDRTTKRDLYEQHGVPEYWQADYDAKNVQMLTPVDGEYKVAGIYGEGQTVVSPLLPNLRLAVDDLF
ncbi:MAG: Uma2 family endonuclease [Chloroflexi bacterium]|nr:Uma2 family endonuclease [Chloroflexota bacterium]